MCGWVGVQVLCSNNLPSFPQLSLHLSVFVHSPKTNGSGKKKGKLASDSQEHRGHQNFGAPTFFFGVFLIVFSNLCWQCSNKTRKCQEHINTLRKKEKLIFLMPILEIKTKNLFSAGKGTRVLVPGHQNSGAPSFFWGFLDGVLTFVLAMF